MSDLISRQDTVDTIRKQLNDTNALVDVIGWKGVDPIAPMIHLISAISALPSTDRPTGEWIDIANDEYYRCSLCGCESGYAFYYCPNCGAKMMREEES